MVCSFSTGRRDGAEREAIISSFYVKKLFSKTTNGAPFRRQEKEIDNRNVNVKKLLIIIFYKLVLGNVATKR